VSSLRSYGPYAYSNNERAKQLLHALDDRIWGMKIIAREESADFPTLDTEKLFSKLKSHELSRKGHPNHDTSLTSKSLITSACVGGHNANSTNTISSSLEFALSSLASASKKRGGCHLGAASSAATRPTSSPTTPRGRSSTPPTSMTTLSEEAQLLQQV
jgi:hypothetical protein